MRRLQQGVDRVLVPMSLRLAFCLRLMPSTHAQQALEESRDFALQLFETTPLTALLQAARSSRQMESTNSRRNSCQDTSHNSKPLLLP